VIDFIFRVLGLEYEGRTDFVHVKPADGMEEGLATVADIAKEENARADLKAKELGLEFEAGRDLGRSLEGARFEVSEGGRSAIGDHLSSMMGDAPFCDVCGHVTVRNGACYKCLNCGSSLGCS
ncbi:MAG: vitamin B12-dependent ribonucleotide reductase, partial [Planctomycetota bacterium]